MVFGSPPFSIRAELVSGTGIGQIELSFDGRVLRDFEQACFLSLAAEQLDTPIAYPEARRDLWLSKLPAAEVLKRAHNAVFGEEASEEGSFWYQRFLFLHGFAPFDGSRSVLLSVPEGWRVAWAADGGPVGEALVDELLFRDTVYDFLPWLETSGVGSFAASIRQGEPRHERAYAKILQRAAAAANRQRKLEKKNAQRP